MSKILLLLYWWCRDFPVGQAASEVGVSKPTAIEWCVKFRDLCPEHLLLSVSGPVGAPGHFVETDKSKIGHRKYNGGRFRDCVWVFGGLDRTTSEAFFVVVEDRSAETLVPMVQYFILPGSTVHSDESAVYGVLRDCDYHSVTVNHPLNFVDPVSGGHTQVIESLWS